MLTKIIVDGNIAEDTMCLKCNDFKEYESEKIQNTASFRLFSEINCKNADIRSCQNMLNLVNKS